MIAYGFKLWMDQLFTCSLDERGLAVPRHTRLISGNQLATM